MTRRPLEDERSFLLRSIEDLDREHAVGDLSDADHAILRDGYVARTAALLRSSPGAPTASTRSGAAPGPTPPPHPVTADPSSRPRPSRASVGGRRSDAGTGRRRRVLVVMSTAAVAAGVVWAVAAHLSPRLPGESVTGSIALSGAQQTGRTLAQAETLESRGNAAEAVKLYQAVLRRDPTQEQALAQVGWLEFEAGAQARDATLLGLGERQEQKAEDLDPGAFAPHLYLGSMALAQGDATDAVTQYRQFLADAPPRATVASAAAFITQAFSDAHLAPPALPGGGSSDKAG
jgi:tetratricopeptide (TPR) repeat protein